MSDYGADKEMRDLYDETIFTNAEIVAGKRVVLHAERPLVEKRDVRGRIAIITRRTVSVRKTIDVDLLHEELQVHYEAGDGSEMIGAEPKTFTVLLRAEEAEIVKRVRVTEEVVVSKKPVVEKKRYEVVIKHERLDVTSEA